MKIKLFKFFSLLIVGLLVFIVTGCDVARSELDKNLSKALDEVELSNETLNDVEPLDEEDPVDNSEISIPLPPKKIWIEPIIDEKAIDHKVITTRHYQNFYDGNYFENIIHIETYEDYLKYELPSYKSNYDEEFFKDNSLIIYDRWEGSGSNKVSITNLTLNNKNELIISLRRTIPPIGTCDMAYWHFEIQYVKIEEPILRVIVRGQIVQLKD